MSIHLLADQGDKSGVAQCIAARANVDESDTSGQKPLHYAAAKGYVIMYPHITRTTILECTFAKTM